MEDSPTRQTAAVSCYLAIRLQVTALSYPLFFEAVTSDQLLWAETMGGGGVTRSGWPGPSGFTLHEGGLGVIYTYGDCGGNGKFADHEG